MLQKEVGKLNQKGRREMGEGRKFRGVKSGGGGGKCRMSNRTKGKKGGEV